MKPTTFENLIAEQQFKISKPDETIFIYLTDCNYFNLGNQNLQQDS